MFILEDTYADSQKHLDVVAWTDDMRGGRARYTISAGKLPEIERKGTHTSMACYLDKNFF